MEEREVRLQKIKKKRRRTIVLSLAGIVLLGAAYYGIGRYQEWKEANAKEESASSFAVTAFSSEDVVSYAVTNKEYSLTFLKEEEVWVNEEDAAFPVKQSRVETMVKSVCGLTSDKIAAESKTDLDTYGLKDPVCSAVLTLQDGSEIALYVGDEAPYSSGYYLMTDKDDKVYLVEASVYNYMVTPWTNLVEMEAVPALETAQIKQVVVAVEGQDALSYERTVDEEGNTTLLPEAFENYTSFSFAATAEYACTDFAAYGLETPYAEITIFYEETTSAEDGSDVTTDAVYTLEIGAQTESGSYYVRANRSPYVYVMTQANAEKLIP